MVEPFLLLLLRLKRHQVLPFLYHLEAYLRHLEVDLLPFLDHLEVVEPYLLL